MGQAQYLVVPKFHLDLLWASGLGLHLGALVCYISDSSTLCRAYLDRDFLILMKL